MNFDANDHREASLLAWEEAAPGWVRRQKMMRDWAAPVSHWMVDAISPQPGERILELAGGLGETGMLAAELVAPMGSVIVSDQAEGMLAGARERAETLGLGNVEFKVLNAEWIDLPLASVDAVLCRWGYMLMADPGAALSETRRVLRPGGRVALAIWDEISTNPWAQLPAEEIAERGTQPATGTVDQPGPFALGDRERVRALLDEAGFTEVLIEAIEIVRRHESFDELWEAHLDVSRSFHDAVMAHSEPEILAIRDSLERRFAPFTTDSGTLEVPGRTLVALASA
jgi:ubiquinone/menaquinone biosynthesis C-methylase UbiE